MIRAEKKNIEKRFLWFNNIPSDWNLVRLKNICIGKLQYGINVPANKYSDSGVRFLRTTDINEDGEVMSDGIYIPKKEVPENYILQKGDLLFSRSGTVGRCYLHDSDEEYCYAGFLVKFKPQNHLLSKWLYYSSLTKEFKYQIFSEAIESTISNFNGNKYAVLRVAFPKNEIELQNIISYLDHQSAKITHFIQTKQRLIELLKEQRQSIIDETLDIKANKVRLKFCVSKVGSGVTPKGGASVYQNSGVIFLRSQNIHNDSLRLDDVAFITDKIHSEMSGSQLKRGDVLLNITGASIGRCYWFNSDEEANVNQHVSIIRPIFEVLDSEFLMYQMQSQRIQHLINTVQGASREGLTILEIKNYPLLLPSTIEEQKRIVEHIISETKTLDIAISKAEREIELIKEYREAMIAEAVTGKSEL